VETKVQKAQGKNTTRRLPSGWSYCNNYDHARNGRIWLCWNNAIWNSLLLASSTEQIADKAKNKGGLPLLQ